MLAHDRYAPSYKSYDSYKDYESEESNQEEGEEEDPKLAKDMVDFLQLRDKLKEKIRRKYKKENAAALGSGHSSDKKEKKSNDAKFGSFFGPSQRVIAPRVIEESRTTRESEHFASRSYPSSSSTPAAARRPSSSAERKPLPSSKPHRVINEVQRKVQTLKETRDYSFLLSDDADLPASSCAPPKAAALSRAPPPPRSTARPPLQKIPERQPRKPEPRIAPPKAIGGTAHSAIRPPAIAKKPISSSSVAPPRPSGRERLTAPSTSAQPRREAPGVPSSKQRALSSSKPHQRATVRPSPPAEREDSQRREKRPGMSTKKVGNPRNPFGDDDDDIDDPMSFLRNKLLSRFNSSKYQDVDGDDSDMEANFEDIMREERRSTKIAKREDEEQLRLIEEEEERERMRREAKRRKILRR